MCVIVLNNVLYTVQCMYCTVHTHIVQRTVQAHSVHRNTGEGIAHTILGEEGIRRHRHWVPANTFTFTNGNTSTLNKADFS